MSVGAKFWSWFTQAELRIFEAQVLKEVQEHFKYEKARGKTGEQRQHHN